MPRRRGIKRPRWVGGGVKTDKDGEKNCKKKCDSENRRNKDKREKWDNKER